jgi:hypothetical protein
MQILAAPNNEPAGRPRSRPAMGPSYLSPAQKRWMRSPAFSSASVEVA